jgi:hypothetical protein
VSGNIFTAGGGYVGRAAIVESKGAVLPDISIEAVRDNFTKICDMSDADEFTNAFDEVSKRLSAATMAS